MKRKRFYITGDGPYTVRDRNYISSLPCSKGKPLKYTCDNEVAMSWFPWIAKKFCTALNTEDAKKLTPKFPTYSEFVQAAFSVSDGNISHREAILLHAAYRFMKRRYNILGVVTK